MCLVHARAERENAIGPPSPIQRWQQTVPEEVASATSPEPNCICTVGLLRQPDHVPRPLCFSARPQEIGNGAFYYLIFGILINWDDRD